jgi:hypothetical protein
MAKPIETTDIERSVRNENITQFCESVACIEDAIYYNSFTVTQAQARQLQQLISSNAVRRMAIKRAPQMSDSLACLRTVIADHK